MTEAFIGIDVAFAKGKRLPVAICSWRDGGLIPSSLKKLPFQPPRGHGNVATLDSRVVAGFADEVRVYIEKACDTLGLTPHRIGIDAPSAPCRDGMVRRAAEQALDAAGISCFSTPSVSDFDRIAGKVRQHLARGGAESRLPHANQLWMLAGFSLYRALTSLAPCIEVYPQATARVLGVGQVHKSQAEGRLLQLTVAASYTGWPECVSETALAGIGYGSVHDRLDAYLSAWVAALPERGRVAFGVPPDDVIWVPRLSAASFDKQPVLCGRGESLEAAAQSDTDGQTRPEPEEYTRLSRLCPGCEQHRFKRWPFGWDAHAAYRCRGISETEPGQRKRAFKRRFEHLFPSNA